MFGYLQRALATAPAGATFLPKIHVLEAGSAGAPHSLWLRMLLGEVLLREGQDLDAAEEQFRRVLQLDPKQKPAAERLRQVQDWKGRGRGLRSFSQGWET